MRYSFTIDDNIRFLKELTEGDYPSLFDHPYTTMLRRLHDRFGVKVQLNLFYRTENFTLAQMTDRYRDEWTANAGWLKLSFHSDYENERPYEQSAYDEVYADCRRVQKEILRFAGEKSLAKTTTIHYCLTTPAGTKALYDNGVRGLLGLYGTADAPMTSYSVPLPLAEHIRNGGTMTHDGIAMAAIDVIVNTVTKATLLPALTPFIGRERVRLMIHEQYFYADYPAYQADFEEKLQAVFAFMNRHGYASVFFEEDL